MRFALGSGSKSRNRLVFTVAAMLALAGCGISTTGKQTPFVLGCLPERAELVEDINWDDALVLNIQALESEFSPMVYHFTRGKAYVLVVKNFDNEANNIWAPDFLKRGVALQSIQIGEGQPANGCINGIRIKALQTVRLNFVAAHEGRFVVHNTALPIIPGQVSDGIFYVDPPREAMLEN